MRTTVILAALIAGLAWSAPAGAHADYVSSSPEDGAVLDAAPAEASVEFDSGLLDAGAAFVVTAADGTIVSIDPPRVGDRRLDVPLAPDLPPGEYRAVFRVVSEDGHTVSDEFGFTVLAASTSTSAPATSAPATSAPATSAPATSTSSGAEPAPGAPPIGLIVGAGVLILGALAAVLLVARRRG